MADPKLDLRLTPARPDLAARHLEGVVSAARYVAGTDYVVADGVAPLHREPSSMAPLETQALKGERITIYDINDEGWAWGQLAGDGYVGWIPDRALSKPAAAATHRIDTLRTFAFPGPSIKLPPRDTLPLGAKVAVERVDGTFAMTPDRLYVPARHVLPLDKVANDFVTVAEMFVTTPYLWGGKTALGIDCSGLVQIALTACGKPAPRDSDMQENGLGVALPQSEWGSLKRGDLIFWKGHVAIVRDADTIVHANAYHMATAIERMSEAISRIKTSGSGVTSIRRLS